MTDYERTTTRETTVTDPTPTTRHPVADRDEVPVRDTIRTSEREVRTAGPSVSSVVGRFVTFLFGVLQAALILRIILLVLVANQGNDIVALILGVTDPFVEPFRGMFALDRVTGDQGSTLDIAAIVALIGWTLVELLILAMLRLLDRRETVVV